MAERDKPTNLGLFNRPVAPGTITATEIIAAALSVLWLLASAVFFLTMDTADGDAAGLRFIMVLMAIFLPVAMIWVAASAARASRIMREESARLQTAIDAMRQTYVEDRQSRGMAVQPSVARKLDEIAAAARQTETAIATFASSRETSAKLPIRPAAPAQSGEDQASLALGTSAEELGPPLSREDFIRALNFPETAEDEEGFAALRRALKDRPTSQLVQASQDILTLLSQDGIYMDDLRPDLAKPEIWRRFASGERGRTIAALGGIRDRSSLALAAGRMRQDPIFRDTAHHFLRRFDKTFVEFEKSASDADIAALANTRTARAFMLLGRVTGTFD